MAGLLDEAKSALQTQIEFKEGELAAGPAKVKVAFSRYQVLGETVKELVRQRTASLASQLEDVIKQAQARIRRQRKRGLVVILDVLDHLTGHPENASEVERSVRHVLLERNELRRLPAHVILTVPTSMIRYDTELARVYSGDLLVMPAVRTRHKDGTPDAVGVGGLQHFVARRADEPGLMEVVFGRDLKPLRRLIAASGGDLRRLQQLLRSCLAERGELPLAREFVDGVIRRASRPFNENLYEEYKQPLHQMLDSAEQRFPRSEQTASLLQELFRSALLLRYHNDDYWEALHPLALRHFDPTSFTRLLGSTERLNVAVE